MSESLHSPDVSRFPNLEDDANWVRMVPAKTALTRIFRAGGKFPMQWHEFREFGPLDARFDPQPDPVGMHPGEGVMYATLASLTETNSHSPQSVVPVSESPFAVSLLEVFQQHRIILREFGAPTLTVFELERPLQLLDLSDSDWITVAGGNAAITSGEHASSRAWARAIRHRYPTLDGVTAASSLVPSARTVALWAPAISAIPRHPLALIRLDREELTGIIDAVAERYGYLLT